MNIQAYLDMINTMTDEEIENYHKVLDRKYKERMDEYIARGGKFVTEEDIESGNVTPYPYLD